MKLFKTHKKAAVVSLALTVAVLGGGTAFAYWTSSGSGSGAATIGTASNVVITQDAMGTPAYSSMVTPMPPDTWSLAMGPQNTGATQFGNDINLAGSPAPLNSVVVALDSWACQNEVLATIATPCVTTPGATFPATITLNIYNPPTTLGGSVGALIATDTQTFNVPYRPSADSVHCAAGTYNWSGFQNDGTQWYDTANGKCYYGTNYSAVFNFSPQNVTLPSHVAYGIAYNVASGSDPASALNIMLSTESTNVSVGSDAQLGTALVEGINGAIGPGQVTNTPITPGFNQYSTASVGGNGFGSTFNIPMVEFTVGSGAALTPGTSQPINFTISNPGSSAVQVQTVTIGIASDNTVSPAVIESTPGDTTTDVTGCLASWFTITNPTVTVGQSVPAGGTIDWVGTTSIHMSNPPVNQDSCQGKSVGLTFSSN